jgi:nucleotide-binding universal stress UspA family protein
MRGPTDLKVVTDRERARLAIAEASRGYDLAVLADPQRRLAAPAMFGATVDEFLRRSPCPTLLVRTPRERSTEPVVFEPWCPQTILVPTVGTERCRHAVEVAAVLAASANAVVLVLHVIRKSDAAAEEPIGEEIVEHHGEWARRFGARTKTLLVEGNGQPDQQILAVARQRGVDLIVLGSGLRVAQTRAFFGHRIERMLEQSPCPVAIVSVS